MIDADALERLTRLAAGRGSLSAAELRQVVPVETMSVDEVASLIDALEQRGIAVEIDPEFLSPGRPPAQGVRVAAAGQPRVDTVPPAAAPRAAIERVASPASPPPRRDRVAQGPSRATMAITLLALAAVIVVVGTLIWAF